MEIDTSKYHDKNYCFQQVTILRTLFRIDLFRETETRLLLRSPDLTVPDYFLWGNLKEKGLCRICNA